MQTNYYFNRKIENKQDKKKNETIIFFYYIYIGFEYFILIQYFFANYNLYLHCNFMFKYYICI